MNKNLYIEKIGKKAKIASQYLSDTNIERRNAVLKKFRGNNYGYYIMQKIHTFLIEKQFKIAQLSAQLYAIEFYEKLGYESFGEIYLDAGIKHKAMKIKL